MWIAGRAILAHNSCKDVHVMYTRGHGYSGTGSLVGMTMLQHTFIYQLYVQNQPMSIECHGSFAVDFLFTLNMQWISSILRHDITPHPFNHIIVPRAHIQAHPTTSNDILRTTFDKYPDYVGNIDVSDGTSEAIIEFRGTDMIFNLFAKGAEPGCIYCGFHIHSGTTCNDATLVGGHYWDTEGGLDDPWTIDGGAVFTTNSDGKCPTLPSPLTLDLALQRTWATRQSSTHKMVRVSTVAYSHYLILQTH